MLSALAEVSSTGAFTRSASPFTGRLGTAEFPAEAGRYVLYVAAACPWACRVLAVLALKGLEESIEVVLVAPVWAKTKPALSTDSHRGWVFGALSAAETGPRVPAVDPLFGASSLRGVYEAAAPDAELKKFTVPLLIDRTTRKIVCNESAALMRDFGGTLFNAVARFPAVDLYPAAAAAEIDAINALIYEDVNDGVYRCGFAQTQAAYDAALTPLILRLRALESHLASRRWLVGASLSEADVRLFVTLVRFDPVYVVYFKTNAVIIRDSPVLLNYLRDVYRATGGAGGAMVGSTVDLWSIKNHYFRSHQTLNPYGIVPRGAAEEGAELAVAPVGRAELP